jgi:hypothetical protein
MKTCVSCFALMNDVNYLISIRYLSGPEDPLNNPISMNEEGWRRQIRGDAGNLVEPIGIEPMTLCLQSRCSPS